MRDNKRLTVKQAAPQGRPFGLEDFIKGAGIVLGLVLAAGLVFLLMLGALYYVIESNFGPEGIRYTMIGLGILFFLWLAARIVAIGENRQIDAFERWLNAMTAHDVAIQRSDDHGEIMRQIAPKLIDNATKHETGQMKGVIEAFRAAVASLKDDMGAADPFAAVGNLPQIAANDWSDDEDDED